MPPRSLAEIEADLVDWVRSSTATFRAQFEDRGGDIWVLRYMSPHYLKDFLLRKQLVISATPGFTWGDGVYVTPLTNPYSTMMYGRIGVLGRIAKTAPLRAYDATRLAGLHLYQEWIRHSGFLYRLLTTTIHADPANRLLRNSFRRRFSIDVTFFRPDQYNKNYVAASADVWFTVSDWAGLRSQGPAQRPGFSSRILDCEWVAVVGEQFEETGSKTHFIDLIGPHLRAPGQARQTNQVLAQQLLRHHQWNAGGGTPPQIAHILA